RSAIRWLARAPDDGVAPLTQLAGDRDDTWLGREATRVLARSGDPRARAFLRSAVNDKQLPEELRAAAIAGLGGDMATGADAKLLRDSYRTLTGQKSKDAALAAVSAVGGSVNAQWLMAVARERDEPPALRRRAITLAERAGATGSQLAALYDAVDDTDARGAVITALGQEGSRPARDKLIAIAQSTELAPLRRRAITALDRFDGVEVREALSGVAARP
ncbi:MAG TPA: HEAT repeat domain-containing protein, partial [Gemmatimonadaceae bacterium]|nr:HEAT repeat domain-containing protein [Gemmatimonadaceae bacterium]